MKKVLLWIVGIFVGLAVIGAIAGQNNSQSVAVDNAATANEVLSKPNSNPVGDLMAQAGQSQVDSIAVQVATDAVEQYGIAKREGDKMQTCVQAMSVSAAFLQAKFYIASLTCSRLKRA